MGSYVEGPNRMKIPSTLFRRTACTSVVWFATALALHAQQWEVTPVFGARFYGTIKLESSDNPRFEAHIADSMTWGIAGGYRRPSDSDDGGSDVFEFRWMRQDTHLYLKQDPALQVTPYSLPALNAFRIPVTLDHYMADFTREFVFKDTPKFQPFLTAGLGVSRLSAAAAGATRFAFDIGTGFKVFPSKHWGARFTVEYLPTIMTADVQALLCTGGCVFAVNGGVVSQFNVTVGPAYRF